VDGVAGGDVAVSAHPEIVRKSSAFQSIARRRHPHVAKPRVEGLKPIQDPATPCTETQKNFLFQQFLDLLHNRWQ
jgi:hypothetical protein